MSVFVSHLAAAQALIVGLVLLWAGSWKVIFPRARALARESALTRLVGEGTRAAAAHLATGCGEILVAALLLVAPGARPLTLALATLLTLGFLGYLAIARRIAPEAPCACMGGRPNPISWRTLLRAGALLAMTLAGWLTPEFWWTALRAAPAVAPLLALEVAALWALSPEFSGLLGAEPRSGPGWRLIRGLRLRLDPACASMRQDVSVIEAALRESAPYRALRSTLGARNDAWREGCWDFIAYSATYERQAATVVFAAPALFDARSVSAAVVADADNAILLAVPSQRGVAPPTAQPA
ncbi:MAG TPA: MauE/DoxX family redox-associated membrane protein [Ktedonobacterales bacterium]